MNVSFCKVTSYRVVLLSQRCCPFRSIIQLWKKVGLFYPKTMYPKLYRPILAPLTIPKLNIHTKANIWLRVILW